MKRVGIVGAGRFGMALAQSLGDLGAEVVLVDRNGSLTQAAKGKVAFPVQADATDMQALEEAGFKECDVAVVAIGSNVEASVLVTSNCKELGVPEVVAKATSEIHGRILSKIGADKVIYPDSESAHRLATSLTGHGALDLLPISEGCSIAEIDVPESCRDKTLAQVDLRKKTGVTVLCIRRVAEDPKKPRTVLLPTPTDTIHADDKLIVFGSTRQIDALSARK